MVLLDTTKYQKGVPRFTTNWYRFLQAANTQLAYSKMRYLKMNQHTSDPVQFVKTTLDKLDDPDFLNPQDQDDLFYNYVIPKAFSVSRQFDPIESLPRNRFVAHSSTKELILPTYGLTGVSGVVLSENDWDQYKNIRPVKLFVHDSSEMNLDFQSAITFTKDKPTFMIFGVDTASLFMQYVKYLRSKGMDYTTGDKTEFAQKYITNYIYDDLLEVWITKLIKKMLNDEDITSMVDYCANEYMGPAIIKLAADDLRDMVDKLKSGNLMLRDFLYTKFYPGGRSIVDIMLEHKKFRYLEASSRYVGFEILKSYDLLNLLVTAWSFQKDLNTSIARHEQQELRNITRANWGVHIRESFLKSLVSSYLDKANLTFDVNM